MNFYEEMKWRGMIDNHTPNIENLFADNQVIGYIGFDPTAPSLTIGNYVQIMILKLFQESGHTPIVLMGGATGRIGDPSGKDKERQLKTEEELDSNLEFQFQQLSQFLNFSSGKNKALLINNLDFYRDMSVLEFLRKAGKVLTVNYMLSKESVKNRMEAGISFTEFSYQLLQAYDFQMLYEKYNCQLQMGGADQWGNITSGTEFIRKNIPDAEAYALTTPLLTKADGTKFGKSAEGNIWLDPEMTSPYAFYQFWLNTNDADLGKFLKYFSLKPRKEIEDLIAQIDENPQAVKKELAAELTARIHSEAAFKSARVVSQFLFNKKAKVADAQSLERGDLDIIAKEIPAFSVNKAELEKGISLIDLLSDHTDICASKSEARRAIKGNAVAINKEKYGDAEALIDSSYLLHGKYILLDNGKKNKFIVSVN
jgi:tyrosyl-tRNA synthetase